jgi:hypothetical protein
VLALVVLPVLLLVTDGRVQALAVVLAGTSLLGGLIFLAVRRSLETGHLLHHLAFIGVYALGITTGNLVWDVTSTLPLAVTAPLGIGAWVGILWLGYRLIYRGPIDTRLDRIRKTL